MDKNNKDDEIPLFGQIMIWLCLGLFGVPLMVAWTETTVKFWQAFLK